MNKREKIKELKKQLIVRPTAKQKAANKAARHKLRKLGVYKLSAEGRANIGKGRTGLHHSPETIAKISATRSKQCKKGISVPPKPKKKQEAKSK